MRQPRESRAPPGPSQGIVVLRRVAVVRTYLALDDPSQHRPANIMAAIGGMYITRRSPCPPELYRRLYKDVGAQWYWHDRLDWSDAQLTTHLTSPDVAVFEMTVGRAGESAGYFELQRHDDGSVEIAYFGLLPEFIGVGLGGWMLSVATDEAWAMGATRVWLHTCTLDSERALPNYRARGFVPYKTERLEVDIDGARVVSERLLRD